MDIVEWKYDYAHVAEWLGHESVDMTHRTYQHEARLHSKKYGANWLFNGPARTREPAKPGLLSALSLGKVDAPAGI